MANINENEKSSASQNKMIAAYLEDGGRLTQMEALNLFGCFRLASRIFDLRERGMNIIAEKVMTTTGKWVCEYRLAK